MKIQKRLHKLDRKLVKVARKLNKRSIRNNRFIQIEYIKLQKKINTEIEIIICKILEMENDYFRNLAIENTALLKNEYFTLRTTRVATPKRGYFTIEMRGILKNDGSISCHMVETNSDIYGDEYPSLFKGSIDCLGNIHIVATKKRTGYRTLPRLFSGNISEHGSITIKTEVLDKETDPSGGFVISEIVGNPFKNKNEKLAIYVKNREKLHKIINEYRYNNALYIID